MRSLKIINSKKIHNKLQLKKIFVNQTFFVIRNNYIISCPYIKKLTFYLKRIILEKFSHRLNVKKNF